MKVELDIEVRRASTESMLSRINFTTWIFFLAQFDINLGAHFAWNIFDVRTWQEAYRNSLSPAQQNHSTFDSLLFCFMTSHSPESMTSSRVIVSSDLKAEAMFCRQLFWRVKSRSGLREWQSPSRMFEHFSGWVVQKAGLSTRTIRQYN